MVLSIYLEKLETISQRPNVSLLYLPDSEDLETFMA